MCRCACGWVVGPRGLNNVEGGPSRHGWTRFECVLRCEPVRGTFSLIKARLVDVMPFCGTAATNVFPRSLKQETFASVQQLRNGATGVRIHTALLVRLEGRTALLGAISKRSRGPVGCIPRRMET